MASVDIAAFKTNGEGGLSGGDLVITPAQTLPNEEYTYYDYEFEINPAGLQAGDTLDVMLTCNVDESWDCYVGESKSLIDIKG